MYIDKAENIASAVRLNVPHSQCVSIKDILNCCYYFVFKKQDGTQFKMCVSEIDCANVPFDIIQAIIKEYGR